MTTTYAPRVSLLVPTRGRPDQFWEMVTSAVATATGSIEFSRVRDFGDPTRDRYLEYPRLWEPDAFRMWDSFNYTEDGYSLSGLWNLAAEVVEGDILMQCADDIRFRTDGWDRAVIDAFDQYPDKIVYVYGRDGITDERMATHGFMHRRWYETLGYFTWPEFSSDYGDLWNHTIAERLGRLHYLPDVYTEHLHPSVGKAELDQTHLDRIDRDADDRNYERWEAAQPALDEAVAKLQAIIDRA